MGSGRMSDDDWKQYATTNNYQTKSTTQIFTSSSLHKDLDPKGVIRESCDSVDNPNSTAVIINFDETGSMGQIPGYFAKEGLPKLLKEIYDRKPITDPHVLCAGIGDDKFDRAPLQVTQFEADIRIAEQLEKIYLEGNGGGNGREGYSLAWYFAAFKTKIDCFKKRGKKGYLFTIGDEQPTQYLRKSDIQRIFGDNIESDKLTDLELLTAVSREWEVFHLIVDQGDHIRYGHGDDTHKEWRELLGERAIHLTDYTKLSEVVVSIIQVMEGEDHNKVADSWNGDTSLVVQQGINGLVSAQSNSGVVTL